MGLSLSGLLTHAATARPRVHLVEAPGGAEVRWAVEDALERRGWRRTPSPAAADVLLVAGRLPAELEAAADLLWSQLPGPRVRRSAVEPSEVEESVSSLPVDLRDTAAHRAEAQRRGTDEVTDLLPDGAEDGHMSPGGIPLAEGAEDRDGLEMDVLVHPLGPLLDRWPGGLELLLTLHGDVVAEVEVRRAAPPLADGPTDRARAWDAVATTLALAGDARGSRAAGGLRRTSAGAPERGADGPADGALATRLRSRVRRWGRLGVLPPEAAAALLTATATDGARHVPPTDVPALLRGRDLADVRLLVAAHTPHLVLGEAARA